MSEFPIINQSITPTPQQGSSIGSALCTQCGLCCTGALHNAAVLEPGEIAGARAIGLPVLDRAKPGFSLPCPMLKGATCTIYGDRPKVCARYKCQLLQEVESGREPLQDALEKVRVATGLVSNAQAAMPSGTTLPEARKEAIGDQTPGLQGEMSVSDRMQLKLRTIALNLYLDKYFRNDRDKKALELTLVERRLAETEME